MASFVLWRRSGSILRNVLKSTKNKVWLKEHPLGKHGHHLAVCVISQKFHTTRWHLKEVGKEGNEVTTVSEDRLQEERFIPITRRSLVRHLMQEKNMLTEEELGKFEHFAIALDSAIVNKHHMILQELKTLFDPINPDKDTVATRQYNRRERLDNEFWLVQKLAGVMERANFHELPKATVHRALSEHNTRERVMVSVNPDNYDLLRVWVLGRDFPDYQPEKWTTRLTRFFTRQPPPKPMEYYKRAVIAVRPKKQDKLLLKAFKEVPAGSLEQLFPDGKIQMSKFDNNIILASAGMASFGILAKIVTSLAKVDMQWSLVFTIVSGLVGFRWWTVYKNRHNEYLLQLSRMLYFKNIANNRGLLTLLVDRAEDELFKESLLSYMFLLTNRPPSTKEKDSEDQLPEELGIMTAAMMERKIEEWVLMKTGTRIEFESGEALQLLRDFGILSEDYETNLHVLGLDAAMRNLPRAPQTLVARGQESDMLEGYDREPEVEDEAQYKEDEKTYRKYFKWF